jgi:hypothetical protein
MRKTLSTAMGMLSSHTAPLALLLMGLSSVLVRGGSDDTGGYCFMCPRGIWCDQVGQHRCPNGTTSSPGASRLDECSCYPGYKPSECTSVVSFAVSLPMTKAAFSPTLQAAYRATVASALSCAEGSVVIVSIAETSSGRRRLLSASIEVVTDITLPAVVGDAVVSGGGLTGVVDALLSIGIGAGVVSVPVMHGPGDLLRQVATGHPSSPPLTLILVIGGSVVLMGVSFCLLYRVRSASTHDTEHHHHYHHPVDVGPRGGSGHGRSDLFKGVQINL